MLQYISTQAYHLYRTSIPPAGYDQLSMISYGRFVSHGAFSWEQVAPDPCFHIITDGCGSFISNGSKHTVKRGDLYIFFPGDHVRYFDTPETPWQYRWCSIAGPVMAMLSDCGIRQGQHLHRLNNLDTILMSLDAIEDLCKNDEPSHYLSSVALNLILDDLSPTALTTMGTAVQAKSIIDSWSFDFPTVEEVAEILKVNRSTLFRCFKAEYGVSVKEYIDRCRMAKAARLLRMSDESVKSIARSCGFWDQLYFSRAFSKYYGLSPSKWRVQSSQIPTAEEAYAEATGLLKL